VLMKKKSVYVLTRRELVRQRRLKKARAAKAKKKGKEKARSHHAKKSKPEHRIIQKILVGLHLSNKKRKEGQVKKKFARKGKKISRIKKHRRHKMLKHAQAKRKVHKPRRTKAYPKLKPQKAFVSSKRPKNKKRGFFFSPPRASPESLGSFVRENPSEEKKGFAFFNNDKESDGHQQRSSLLEKSEEREGEREADLFELERTALVSKRELEKREKKAEKVFTPKEQKSKIKEFEKTAERVRIFTSFDKILLIVNQKGVVKAQELIDDLKMSSREFWDCVGVLEKNGALKVEYPAFGSVKLVSNNYTSKGKKILAEKMMGEEESEKLR